MRAWLLLVAILAVPGVAACQDGPYIAIDVPDITGCDASCPVAAPGQTLDYEGVVRWSWTADQCTPETGLMRGDMKIDMRGTEVGLLHATVEPSSITVSPVEYYDPRSADLTGDDVRLGGEAAVTVSIAAPPEINETEAAQLRNGLTVAFVKAYASGEGVRDTFGVTALTFNASLIPVSGPAPAADTDRVVPAPWGLGALALAALVRYPTMRR